MSPSAPFPWFGGKSIVAADVWSALGDVAHYIEPFAGSAAVLLARPSAARVETINDVDGLLANFWRAVASDPLAVADHAHWPCNEADLHARHLWLIGERPRITERLMADPSWFDAQAAGWWVWGSCNWIGSGWCSGEGPWTAVHGEFVDSRQLPHLSGGRGVNRKLPHLGDGGQGVNRQLPHLSGGRGVNRQLPHLGDGGQGVNRKAFIQDWFAALADRLHDVRVACGDWTRVCGPSVLSAAGGVTGVFLDPPYDQAERAEIYACDHPVAADVSAWCAANGNDPKLRIVVAGYSGEHDALTDCGWKAVAWKAKGGYGLQGEGRGRDNASRERLWLSPHCFGVKDDLFSMVTA